MEKINKENLKKQRKYQHTLVRQTGVECSIIPTKYLAICNSGLVNGLSKELIYEHFSKYGTLIKILTLPGKSCCFVSYECISSSQEAFKNINGKLNIAQYNKPIYLSYVKNLPDNLIIDDYSNVDPPNGLFILENFVTEDEEKLLLEINDFNQSGNSLKHRQVKHYGYEFKYDTNNIDINSPLEENIPKECDFLWERLKIVKPDVVFTIPDQLTVNHYSPGQGIPPHVDTHSAFDDPIFLLSLGSDIVMDFKKGNDCQRPVLLPRRSFTIMSGESRYAWTHGITPRKMDIIISKSALTVSYRKIRISYTFRTALRDGECFCKFTNKCDSYQKRQTINDIKIGEIAERLEETHVHTVYENIAQHFSETRHKPWPNVVNFIKSFDPASILVDVGCGNGKYMNCGQRIFQIGLDTSISLLNVCRDRNYQALLGNCLRIPLLDRLVDGVISIAVIHHLSTSERRLQAIQEIVRILKVGGKALIYVWAKDQNHENKKTNYLKQDRKNKKSIENEAVVDDEKVTVIDNVELPVHTNRTQFQHQDLLVPWKLKNNCNENTNVENDFPKTFLRFYHVFEEGELEKICTTFNNVKLLESYYDQGNWCVILEKK